MIMKIPTNTTIGSSDVAVPAASDFSSHCPAEIKEKYLYNLVTYSMPKILFTVTETKCKPVFLYTNSSLFLPKCVKKH